MFCDVFDNDWNVLAWYSSSNDVNNQNIQDIIQGWANNGKWLVTKEDAVRHISGNGSISGNIQLINLPQVYTETSSSIQTYVNVTNHQISDYQISPRFKQILTYETDN